MLTENLLVAPATGFAVICGVEKFSSVTSSMFSPVMVTSTLCPACPPIGIMVSKRGSGSVTCCAEAAAVSKTPAARMSVDFVNMVLVIEKKLLRVQQRPEKILVAVALGPLGVEGLAIGIIARLQEMRFSDADFIRRGLA